MSIEKKILEEIRRYKSINRYITEQEATLPPPPSEDVPPTPETGELPTPDIPQEPTLTTGGTTPIDVKSDPDVEKLGEKETEGTEEIDVTDIVKGQKSIEQKQDDYFESLFKHLDDLETKLNTMDGLVQKLNDLESKIDRIRPKTPEEKLELRSLDSGPFNQKLSDFFEDKEEDFKKLGRDEYILTQDEVENFNPSEIKKSFRDFGGEDGEKDFVRIK